MKRLLFGVIGPVILLVVAAFFGPSFVDWNSHKAGLTAAIQQAIGRSLTIDGDLELALLPTPALTASSVSLQKNPDGSGLALAELDELRLKVAFWPLFRGQVQVESLVFVRPTLRLEVLPDGRRNWDFAEAAAGAEQAGETWLADRLRFDRYTVEDGTLIFQDAAAGSEERIEQINAAVTADTTEGRFTVDGQAVVRGLETEFDATLDRLDPSGTVGLEAVLELPRAEASGVFSGNLTRQSGSLALHGSLTGGGPNLAALIAATAPDRSFGASPGLEKSFTIKAEVSSNLEQLTLTGLDLILGEARLNGGLSVQWRAPVRAEARLSAATLDLDQLLASSGAVSAGLSGWRGAAPDFALPSGFDADLELQIGSAIYRGEPVRQLHLIGDLENGQVTIYKGSALLPGGTEISLSGSLTGRPPGPSFVGYVTAESDSLRATLDWLGADLSGVPADRLGRTELSGEISATTDRLDLRDLDLMIDGDRIQGGVAVALKDRPALGVGLLIDRLDLAAYLGDSDRSELLAARFEELLQAFDANLDLRVGSLVHPGATIEDLRLVGTLHGDSVTVKEASGQDLAGNFLRYAGTLSRLGSSPTLAGSIELKVADPDRFAKLADIDPEPLVAIGPFELEGDLAGDPSDIAFEVRVAAQGGRFDLEGSVRPLAAPAEFALTLEAAHEDLAKLINRIADRPLLGPGLGRLAAKARLVGTTQQIEISALSGTIGPSRVRGGLTVDLSDSQPRLGAIDLDLSARHANLARLLAALDLPSPVEPAFGGIDFTGKVSGSDRDLRVSGLTGRIGPIAVRGALSAELTASGPALTDLDLDIKARHPSLAGFLAALTVEAPITPAFGAVAFTGRVSGRPAAVRLSGLSGRIGPLGLNGAITADLTGAAPALTEIALDLSIMHPNLAELAAALGRPDTVKQSFGGIDVRGSVAGDLKRIEVRELQGTIGPGELRGSIAADLRGAKPMVELDLTTGPLPVAVLLGSLGGSDAEAGALSIGWSDEPIDLSLLHQFDADITVNSTAWLYDGTRLEDAALRATLRGGRLDLRTLTGKLYGGAIRMVGKVKAGKQLDVGLTLDAVDLELAQFLRSHTGFDRVTGPVTVRASLITEGSSEAELVSALNGRGTLAGSLTVVAKAQEAASAALLALLGGDDEALSGSDFASHTLLNTFAGEAAKLKGSFAVTRGVVRTDDARIDGRGAYALTRGQADLAAWRLDSRVDVYRHDNLEDSYLTVDLAGPLEDPNSGFRSQRADALLGSSRGSLIDRVQDLRAMIGEVVDFEPMARYVLGRHTETITPAQWSRFLQQYEKLFRQGYELSGAGSLTGEWNIQNIRPYGDDLLITVAFQNRSGNYAKVGFRVREKKNALFGFKIVDAISDGVSFLVTQRGEFSSILNEKGIDGLVRELEREFSDTDAEPQAALPAIQDREALRIAPHQTRK